MKWIKRKSRPLPEEHICHNCGTQTIGNYCHECGQSVFAGKEQPILHLFGQMLENAFSLDTKAPRTLALIMFRPGFLSAEYRAGKICRYVHPVKLFWMSTLVMFGLMVYQLSAITKGDRDLNKVNTKEMKIITPSSPEAKNFPQKVFIDFLSSYAPYISFIFIPIFALLLALFFWRKKYYYISHLIFTVHFHTFLWIYWSVLMLIHIFTPHWDFPTWLSSLLFITPGVYFAIALHRFYQTKSRWGAVWRAILIPILYFILIGIVVVFLVGLMEKANLFPD